MSPSEAARQLRVSIKALRLYERRGLLAPARTSAGYRVYGPDVMARAARIIALRALGLSLSQIAQVLDGDPRSIDAALLAHEQALEKEIRRLASTMDKVRALRAPESAESVVSFELPWPWAGERFELRDIRPLNYIVGPLGSGKTRFAQRLAESLPGASFLGLERLEGTDPLTALLRGLQAAGPIIVDMVEQGHRILARGVTNQFRRVWLRPRCAPG
jgi:DNA-binding transcriptional MerR regulator